MRRYTDIAAERIAPRESVVSFTVRSPEAAKAIHGASHALRGFAWLIGAVLLVLFAWRGGFGATTQGFIHLTVAGAVLYWAIAVMHDLWRERERTRFERLTVRLTPTRVLLERPGHRPLMIDARDCEVRFASRAHWLGRREEREERRIGRAIGYEYRDAWEVWCEAGLEIVLIAALSCEEDARAVVRHLTEEMTAVGRGAGPEPIDRRHAEPV